jgi:thioester reductase-like protein
MKNVLLTGASGAIGSALVPLFLWEPDVQLRLLLRADSPEHVHARLAGLARFWAIDRDDPQLGDRVRGIRGDVCAPQLGLSAKSYELLTAEATHVVHAAGNVKLNRTLAEARRDALDATRNIVAFVEDCRRSGNRFQKLDLVSTVGVAGRTRGLVHEEPPPFPHRFHNTYEAAKAEAEHWLLSEMRAGLPATIHRPSMVVGNSQTGEIIHFQVFYHLSEFLTGSRTWGLVPRSEATRLDIIPVDYVARAIHLASARNEAIGRIFHLCAGPDRAPTLKEITDRLRLYFTDKGRRLPPLRHVSAGWFRALLPVLGGFASRKARRAFQGLRFFLDYLDEEQVFDNSQARAFFAPLGLEVPSVADYLLPVMSYYWAEKYQPPRPKLNTMAAVGTLSH